MSGHRPEGPTWPPATDGSLPAQTPELYDDLPPALEANALAWLESRGAPVPTRDASTVLLLRTVDGHVEVFVLRRAASMAFAASAYVFPGGGVDVRDADETLPWSGPSPEQWARRLAASNEAQARELVVAAARELFEECGVLLAGPDADTVVADLTAPEWDVARKQLVSRELSFAELLSARGLVLRTDLLRAVDHWITPEFEPRRYDTRFFVAALPVGQIPDDDCTEAEHARWVRPADLLAEHAAGSAMMLPPTVVSLQGLQQAEEMGVAGADLTAALLSELDSERPLPVVLPHLIRTSDGVRLARRWVRAAEGPS